MKTYRVCLCFVLFIMQTACSQMAFYEGMRTEQQRAADMNRGKADPLPPFDKYKKERDAMQPGGQ
jgi:hypothetical protein